MNKEEVLKYVTEKITQESLSQPVFGCKNHCRMPSKTAIIDILENIKKILFPGFFDENTVKSEKYYIGYNLRYVYHQLLTEIKAALFYSCCDKADESKAETICNEFFGEFPLIQQLLLKDVQAGFDGDPAAKSKEEIIYSYPGLFAIFVYRIAHSLYKQNLPLIPRIMTEYAHSLTGIDIHPGAEIGEYFFIDHGTGVVIGETTIIGNHVKLYQGVTLGALSTRSGQQLSGVKRHPTIKDNVTIYSGASILGGETVVGENSIIGGNCFVTKSVPENSKVSAKLSELILKPRTKPQTQKDWEI